MTSAPASPSSARCTAVVSTWPSRGFLNEAIHVVRIGVKMGVAPHQAIRSDEVSLTRLAHAGTDTHDRVEPIDRHLEQRNTDLPPVRENGGCDEARRCFIGRRVALVIDQENRIRRSRRVGESERFAEVRSRIRPVDERRAVVEFLEHGIDDVTRFRVREEDVVIPEFLQIAADDGMNGPVQ